MTRFNRDGIVIQPIRPIKRTGYFELRRLVDGETRWHASLTHEFTDSRYANVYWLSIHGFGMKLEVIY